MAVPVHLDPSRPVPERVDAIIALMTDEQKLSCFRGIPEGIALADGTALPSLDNRFIEALHGSGHSADATLFPQAIGLGATWNTELVERVGAVVSDELRAREDGVLAAFGPVADIRSNPLAGRFEEGFAEDPLLTGAMVTAFGFGLRGRHPVYIKCIPEMKHFLAYNHEWNRSRSSSSMGVRALYEYQAVPYRMPVEAGAVHGAMTAYNLVNGVPAIIGPLLDELRDEWLPEEGFVFLPDGWDGVNLTVTKGAPYDTWEAPEWRDVPYPLVLAAETGIDVPKDRIESFEELVEESLPYSGALMLLAGQTNFADGSELRYDLAAADAVRKGLWGATMADAERVARDWLTFMIRTGLLDGDACPYNAIDADPHPQRRPEHQALALQAAREQTVLLKNDGLLPLDPSATVALSGPLSDVNLRDYYSPLVAEEFRTTPLDAFRERVGERVRHTPGVDVVAWSVDGAYVTPGDDGILTASAADLGDSESFEVYDWAHDQYFFRNKGNRRFLDADYRGNFDGPATFENQAASGGTGQGPFLRAVDEHMIDANAWFTEQNFHYRREGDRVSIVAVNHVEANPQPENAYYLRVDADGRLPLTQGEPAAPLTETVVADGPAAAAAHAAESDVAVVVVGNHPLINARETYDRPGLDLAQRQADLVREVAAAKPGRTVVVVVSSYPLAIGDIAADPNVAAIVHTSHAGQAAGTALVEALYGDYSPAGRLTATWLADTSSLPQAGPRREPYRVGDVDLLEYDVIDAGLTYRFSAAEPVYAFGHGLTYTEFAYGALEVAESVGAEEPFAVALDVTNTGDRTSDEVVQLYARSLDSVYGSRVPKLQLAGFTRAKDLAPGETRRVAITVDPRALAVWDATRGELCVEAGRYELHAGASSVDLRSAATVRVDGREIPPLELWEGRNAWECATDSRGVDYWVVSRERVLNREGGYHSVVSRRAGDCVGFTRVDLDGASGIELRAATSAADWADLADPVVEVRADAPDGELLGEVAVSPTGGVHDFADAAAPLSGATGVRNLYLRFRAAGVYVETVRLTR